MVTFDLKSAYDVPSLTRLERTFTYSRGGGGSLLVTDHVEFSEPQSYEGALITLGKYKEQGKGELLFTDGKQSLRVKLDTGGNAYQLSSEEIKEDAPVKPTRVGIKLTSPVKSATVSMLIEPAK